MFITNISKFFINSIKIIRVFFLKLMQFYKLIVLICFCFLNFIDRFTFQEHTRSVLSVKIPDFLFRNALAVYCFGGFKTDFIGLKKVPFEKSI